MTTLFTVLAAQGSTPPPLWRTVLLDAIGPLTGAAAGAVGGFRASLCMAQRTDRRTITDQLVAEFFSDDFLSHRVAVHELWTRVKAGQVSIASVAGGFWSPGRDHYYTGPRRGALNLHQHLEAYIGYIVRLAHALEAKRLDRDSARAALGMHLQWHDTLVQKLEVEVAEQAKKPPHPVVVPDWTRSAAVVRAELVKSVEPS